MSLDLFFIDANLFYSFLPSPSDVFLFTTLLSYIYVFFPLIIMILLSNDEKKKKVKAKQRKIGYILNYIIRRKE